MKVVFPMAGIGKRLRPHTFSKPKPLISLAGKPILAHILDYIAKVDIDEIVFIVGYLGGQIEEFVKSNYSFKSTFIEQQEPLGQAHALHLARATIDQPFMIVFADTIFEADLSELDDSDRDGLIYVHQVADPSRFGVVTVKDGFVERFIEKPKDPVSNLAITGIYFINDWRRFLAANGELIDRGISTGEEYWLADTLQLMVGAGSRIQVREMPVWADCGTAGSILETHRYLLTRYGGRSEPAIAENSSFISPCWVGSGAKIVRSVIGPYVTVGAGAQVHDSIISDSILGAGATVREAVAAGSLVGDRVSLTGHFSGLNVGDDSVVE